VTEESLARILESFEHLSPRIDALTRSFYAKLFAANPQLRPLFKLDIDVQSQHLAAALALIIRNLRLLDVLEEPLMDLGAGHARVGVRPEHYPLVCQTMIQTLREACGENWSHDLESDWTGVLERISRIMMHGALRGQPNIVHSQNM